VVVPAKTIGVLVGQDVPSVMLVYVVALFVHGTPFAGELHQLITAPGTVETYPPGMVDV